ncbi:efflux transporter periplasmic adaptor subunit [Termitidicoccus mucosus]|uniref:Efflux transporter periplasmic adaptor subunit n=2 Tax=Termitidicoccus mucosus TaxID=1184151 RepID=A0A178IGT0_9BACT|nr:efflux transporter periplasmic adaptor subunit [Opitutaceae bacterium TSB47]
MKPRLLLPLLVLLGIVAVVAWRLTAARASAQSATAAAAAARAPRSVPVVIADAVERDVPVWLSGIGAVQAYNTVTVRPRVGGTLDSVNFSEGQTVAAGDVIAQIDPRPYRAALDRAIAQKAQYDAQLKNARLELVRIRSLVASNAESRQLLEQNEAAVAQYEALSAGAQAAIDAARLDLDFTTVRAPIAGRTGVRRVDAGNIVTAGQPDGLVVLTQIQPVSVVFTLPQRHLAALRPGAQKAAADAASRLIVQALDDQGGVLADGRLDLVDNQIDAATGTLRLKATFPNASLALWPGQFVSARVLVETRPHAVVVPTPVVQNGLDGPFAYVVTGSNTVEPRPVKPGPVLDGYTLIESGLLPGERVVVDGHAKLKPGSLVRNAEHGARSAE